MIEWTKGCAARAVGVERGGSGGAGGEGVAHRLAGGADERRVHTDSSHLCRERVSWQQMMV